MKRYTFISVIFLSMLLAPVAVLAGNIFFPIHREAMTSVESVHITGTCDACRGDFLVESLVSISDNAPIYVCEGCVEEIAVLLAILKESEETGFAVPYFLTPFVVTAETTPAWLRDSRFTITGL